MIELFSTNVTSTTGMLIPLNNTALQRGYSATLANNKTDIQLNFPGVYEITVNAYGDVTAIGDFGIQLNADGNPVTRAASSMSVGAGGTGVASFNTLVSVLNTIDIGTAYVNIEYTGGDGTITLLDVVVKRVQ